MDAGHRNPLLRRLVKLAERRLVRPLFRSRRPPEFTARGTFVGLFVAFTPTFGAQMPLVIAIWTLVRALRKDWSFNLAVALAWTWTTNVITVPPVYYAFIVTGRLILGRWKDLRDYETFVDRFSGLELEGIPWYEELWTGLVTVVERFGLPLVVGSLPWAVLIATIGYIVTVQAIRRRRARVDTRGASERKSRTALGTGPTGRPEGQLEDLVED